MAEPLTYDYFVYKLDGEVVYVCCDGGTKEDGEDIGAEWEHDEMECVVVNKNHYFTSFFFYNDETDYDDTENHEVDCFNTKEHMDAYASFDYGGHFQQIRWEEWKDGKMVNSKLVSTEDGYL